MIVTTTEKRDTLIKAGKRLGEILQLLAKETHAGVSTATLEERARALIYEQGDVPAFLNYTPEGAHRPYPSALCLSVNDEVVHGIPQEVPKVLKNGDVVSLDLGLIRNGVVVDAAISVIVGTTSKQIEDLLHTTKEALYAGIAAAKVGGRIGDISSAIESAFKKTPYAIVKELGGHGVGDHVHEEPWVANFGKAGTGPEIVEGMVLALEPIATLGKAGIKLASDGYTYRTKDGSIAAHFEHTILIEKSGVTIVTEA
jgi:methionyl aminopeptidase